MASRDSTTTAQAGTTETALVSSVSRADPRGAGKLLFPAVPLLQRVGASCAGGTLPHWGVLGGGHLPRVPHALSQHLLFFQDHGTKGGKGAAPTTDLRSLSPVRGGRGATSQAKLGKATLWLWEWVGLVPLGPCCVPSTGIWLMCWYWEGQKNAQVRENPVKLSGDPNLWAFSYARSIP